MNRRSAILLIATLVVPCICVVAVLRMQESDWAKRRVFQTQVRLEGLAFCVVSGDFDLPAKGGDAILHPLLLREELLDTPHSRMAVAEELVHCTLDAWGNPIKVRWTGGGVELISFGPNGENNFGAGDDMVKFVEMDEWRH
jgi:hypothetical protein